MKAEELEIIKKLRNSVDPDVMGGEELEGVDLERFEPVAMKSVGAGYDYSRYSEAAQVFAAELSKYGLTLVPKLTKYNFTDRNNTERVAYCVDHYFGGLGSAASVAGYFASGYVKASAHLAVDESTKVYLCVDFADVAWHCGDSGRGTLKGKVTNSNSIGIEVRPRKLDPYTAASAAAQDWYFDAETENNLLIVHKCLQVALPQLTPERVCRHFDVTSKWCPRPWMGGDANEYYGCSGNEMWDKFKARLCADEESEDEDTVRYARLSDIPNDWGARDIVEKLMDAKIIKGDGSDPDGNEDVIDLSVDMVRMLAFNYRGGCYDAALVAAGLPPVVGE